MKTIQFSLLMSLLAVLLCACDHVNNKEVPAYVVRIDLGTHAMWSTYGVSGVGDYRYFNREMGVPQNFPFNANTHTGYGGVLLMMALDASTGNYEPVAYDGACPVENVQSTVVGINGKLEAVCPKCGSRYNVLTGLGGPIDGVAHKSNYGLRIYKVRQSGSGGYVITNN
ncbi:MAG: hypothetical protein IIZ89_00085 [Muribaculaceae bacterium]|nr:hypothetical protein [Muribaculaceae bacterium]